MTMAFGYRKNAVTLHWRREFPLHAFQSVRPLELTVQVNVGESADTTDLSKLTESFWKKLAKYPIHRLSLRRLIFSHPVAARLSFELDELIFAPL